MPCGRLSTHSLVFGQCVGSPFGWSTSLLVLTTLDVLIDVSSQQSQYATLLPLYVICIPDPHCTTHPALHRIVRVMHSNLCCRVILHIREAAITSPNKMSKPSAALPPQSSLSMAKMSAGSSDPYADGTSIPMSPLPFHHTFYSGQHC